MYIYIYGWRVFLWCMQYMVCGISYHKDPAKTVVSGIPLVLGQLVLAYVAFLVKGGAGNALKQALGCVAP